MTEPDNFSKSAKFTEELSEVRSVAWADAPGLRQPTRNQRISVKASQVQALLDSSTSTPDDRRINLLRTALLRKDEAILDGLLEELGR